MLCLIVRFEFLWLKILIKFSKFRQFSIKIGQNMHFLSNLFKFAECGDLKTTDIIFLNSKRELLESRRPVKVFWN